jgi:hypothetical protein
LALEQEIQGKYDLAKKDDLNLSSLQRMSGEEIAKLANKEGIEDVSISERILGGCRQCRQSLPPYARD